MMRRLRTMMRNFEKRGPLPGSCRGCQHCIPPSAAISASSKSAPSRTWILPTVTVAATEMSFSSGAGNLYFVASWSGTCLARDSTKREYSAFTGESADILASGALPAFGNTARGTPSMIQVGCALLCLRVVNTRWISDKPVSLEIGRLLKSAIRSKKSEEWRAAAQQNFAFGHASIRSAKPPT